MDGLTLAMGSLTYKCEPRKKLLPPTLPHTKTGITITADFPFCPHQFTTKPSLYEKRGGITKKKKLALANGATYPSFGTGGLVFSELS